MPLGWSAKSNLCVFANKDHWQAVSLLCPPNLRVSWNCDGVKSNGVHNYRPQGKVMFSEACVILFTVHGGGGLHLQRWGGKVGLHLPSPPLWMEEPPPPTQVLLSGQKAPRTDPPVLTSSGHHSGWYASYWNAVLFYIYPRQKVVVKPCSNWGKAKICIDVFRLSLENFTTGYIKKWGNEISY